MSVLISNHHEIVANPSNSSPSKAQYSFNKEPRFTKSYKLYNPSPNRKLCYFDGEILKKQSTLSKENGKFDKTRKLNNIFIELNRHHIKTPSAFNYSLPSIFKAEKIKNK